MMNIKKLMIFALAVGALNSCAVDNISLEEDYIHAIMENDDTRTTVTDEGSFTWSSGDKIWLHTTSGSVVGTLSSGAGTSSANFSFSSHFGEMTGMAVYPYNSDHSVDGDVLSVVLPASYELGSNLTNTNAAMFGVTIDGTLNFTHLAGVMRFVFKNVPAGTDKFKITLDKKINGTFTADLTQECPVLESEETSVDAEKTITFNFDALTSMSDIRLYVPLPLGTYKTLALELSAGNQSVWTYSNTVTNKINRKSLKLMPVVSMGGSIGGEIEGGSTGGGNLSSAGTANSYIVSAAGSYTFTPTKGNSNESVGEIASAEVLWETFGTDVTPNVGDLVRNVKYADGVISFETPSTYREGNAVIAAKDASGTILWSWHIWLTDQPEGQEYYSLCTMMDRNLGATSATPGDVGALGLLYQWGRKDPFLGSSSIHYESMTEAKSTITWPSSVSSDSSTGTIAYATANPTTFITENSNNYDWYYTGDESTDNTRWKESTKSIYDPCPAGWRVPNGGSNGVWAKALGSSDSFKGFPYDSTIEGISLPGNIWYPASGYRYDNFGSLEGVGNYGFCWSASTSNIGAYGLGFNFDGDVYPSEGILCSAGISVRCLKESSGQPVEPEVKEGDYVDEYGVNQGQGVKIGETIWAPVNCGYHETDFKYGKLYQWGRKYGQGYLGGLNDDGSISDDSDAIIPIIIDKRGSASLDDGQAEKNKNVFFSNTSTSYDTSDYWRRWWGPRGDDLWPITYNPCPEGWRPPSGTQISELMTYGNSDGVDAEGRPGRWFSDTKIYSKDDAKLFLPYTGRINYDGWGYYRGNTAYYWSTTTNSHYVYALYLTKSEIRYVMQERAYGAPLRCVRM